MRDSPLENGHKTTIDYAEWPRDAPSALERNVITIICGNTRLHWALHEGSLNKFIPIMFWYTAHEESEAPDDLEADPCDILEAHVANQAHTLIFGDVHQIRNNNNTKNEPIHLKKSVSQTAAKRDAPGISVYVVSSNPAMERKICRMFRDVPAKLFKLRNTDFFSAEQGVYPTMGVDRVAALYGARLHYGAPALVIDGGTAMTYTMLDASSTVVGGGIGPGVKIRLQSMADYTGALPTIDHKKFKSTVEAAMTAKKPLPFFAKDTEMAMISPVCGELACHLRNIIKQYVAKCQSSSTTPSSSTKTTTSSEGEGTAESSSKQQASSKTRFPVIITGGDGKFLYDLLQTKASGIVAVEPDAAPVPTNVEIRHVKNLVSYALGDILYEKFSQKPMHDPEEKLRLKIQGLRIASPGIDQAELFSRGCVYRISPESMIEGYVFHARFDSGAKKDLTLKELYDCLVLYNEIGERKEGSGTRKTDEDWVVEKKMWSRKVQEELGNLSRLIRNRIRQLKPHIEKGELKEIFKRRSTHSVATSSKKGKKAKRMASAVKNPKNLLGKRIAKRFPVDPGENGDACDQVFFGTVKYLSDSHLHWYFVVYDDGDSEDLGVEEILDGIDAYEVHKFNDPIHQDDAENVASQQGQPGKSKPRDGTAPESGTAYTDLSTLLGMSSSSPEEYERQISEFKEDI